MKVVLSGLFKHSFVPDGSVRKLRSLLRLRRKPVNERRKEKNRLQNLLEDAKIKYANVARDVFSKTGQGIIT